MYSIYFFIQILIFRLLNNKLYFNLLYALTNLCLACYILLQTGFYKEIETPFDKINLLSEIWFLNTKIYWFIDILLIFYKKLFYGDRIRKDQIIHHLVHIIAFKIIALNRLYHVGYNILFFAELSEPFSIMYKIFSKKIYSYFCALFSIIRTIYFFIYLKNLILIKWKYLPENNKTIAPYIASLTGATYLVLLLIYCRNHIKRALIAAKFKN